ncbi:MAG: AsmA family protein [Rhodobiaceae bacterium]|nr:AsmA family protein [Rhodobiaceae bacterium]
MNTTLLTVGIAVVLAFVAALVVPFFVDWNAHRGLIEARLGALAGRQVVLAGPLDVQILPMPVITARDVQVLAPGGAGPQLSAQGLRARIALTPLLSGEVRIEEIRLDDPVLRLPFSAPGTAGVRRSLQVAPAPAPAGENGGDEAAESGGDARRVSLLALEIRNGTLVLGDEAAPGMRRLSGINMSGSADSLAGPFRAEGGARLGEALYTFRFGTGRARSDGTLRTKFFVQPASGAYEIAGDGLFYPSPDAPGFAGQVNIHSLGLAAGLAAGGLGAPRQSAAAPPAATGQWPWRIGAKVQADPARVAIESLELALGAEERAVKFTGAGSIALTPEIRVAAALEARQIDFDRALAGAPGLAAPVADLAGGIGMIEDFAARLPVPLKVDLTAEAAVIGGGLVEKLELSGEFADGGIKISDFDARLPGHARVNGRIDFSGRGAAREIDARIRVNAQRVAQLTQWLAVPALKFGALELQTADSALSAEGRIVARAEEVRVEDLKAWLDDSLVEGHVSYARGARPGLDLELAVDTLDFDRYVKLVRAAGAAAGESESASSGATGKAGADAPAAAPFDINLRLNAKALTVAGVAAKALAADLDYESGSLVIKSFQLGDVGGTAISAQGRIDDLFGNAEGKIEAAVNSQDLTGIAKLAGDLNLITLDAKRATERSRAMSPAALEMKVTAQRTQEGTQAKVQLAGTAGGTSAEGELVFRGKLAQASAAAITFSGKASNPQDRLLALQAGLPAGPEAQGGEAAPGAFEVSLDGVLAEGAKASLTARLYGADARLEGVLSDGDGMIFTGGGALQVADMRAIMAAAGLAGLEDLEGVGAELSASISRRGEGWELNGIAGEIGARKVTGALALSGKDGRTEVSGHIDTDALDAVFVLARLFGAGSLSASDGVWPQGAFDLAVANALGGKLRIGAKEFIFSRVVKASDAVLELSLDKGEISVNRFAAQLFGGALDASLRVNEQRSGATMQARLSLKNGALEEVLARGAGKAAARGRFDLAVQLAGGGRNWQEIAASVSGEGSFVAREGSIDGLDPQAFSRLIEAADAGLELDEERVLAAFSGYLDSGALAFASFEGAFSVNDGIVSAKNVPINGPAAKLLVSSHYDIAENRVDSEWMLAPSGGDAAVTSGAPSVAVLFTGPVEAPERSIDVSALAGFLTVRRLEADVRRLEAEQAKAAGLTGKDKAQPGEGAADGEAGKAPPQGPGGQVGRLEEGAGKAAKDEAPQGERAAPGQTAPRKDLEQKDAAVSPQAPMPPQPPMPAIRPDHSPAPAPALESARGPDQESRNLDSIVEEALRGLPPGVAPPPGGDGLPRADNGQGSAPIVVLPPPGANIGQAESDITRSIAPRAPVPVAPPLPEQNSIALPFPDHTGSR